ncbi:tetraspanin-33-like isoform X2 [Ornithodoros turicata]|uniref:tetraspanin-33-like isoform X2 n=1 Tax=Ornithodoros turicata TaxID=34597 RepID=UPI0031394A3B
MKTEAEPPMIDVSPLQRYPLVIINLLLMIISGIVAAISTIHDYVTVDLIVHYRDNDDFMRVIDFMQYTFQCCGITDDGYRDWNQNIYFNCSRTNPSFEKCSVPASCCCRQQPDEDMVSVLSRRFCGQDVLSKTQQDAWAKIHTRSCTDAVTARIKASSFYIVIGCSVVTIILTILRSMALNVRKEIVSVTGFYEKYYAAVRRGERKSLAKQQALMNIPKGCVEMKRKRQPAPPKPQPSPAQHRSPVLVHGQPRHALDPDEMESSPMARLP